MCTSPIASYQLVRARYTSPLTTLGPSRHTRARKPTNLVVTPDVDSLATALHATADDLLKESPRIAP